MMRKTKPVVYGVFGDTPRSDKDNIESMWFDKNKAKERMDWLNENDEYSDYHIETIEMDDDLER